MAEVWKIGAVLEVTVALGITTTSIRSMGVCLLGLLLLWSGPSCLLCAAT
jgi:hypothetical protein